MCTLYRSLTKCPPPPDAPEATLRARVRQRARVAGADASEADAAVLETQLSAREPFEEEELACVVPIDTRLRRRIGAACAALLARLWPGAAAGELTDTHQHGKQ